MRPATRGGRATSPQSPKEVESRSMSQVLKVEYFEEVTQVASQLDEWRIGTSYLCKSRKNYG